MRKKYHLVAQERLALPKSLGGWDVKHMHWFNLTLCLKIFWRTLFGNNLWSKVCLSKYFKKKSLSYWLKAEEIELTNSSITWNSFLKTLHWLRKWTTSQIGNCKRMRIRIAPFVEDQGKYLLPMEIIEHFNFLEISTLNQIKKTKSICAKWGILAQFN